MSDSPSAGELAAAWPSSFAFAAQHTLEGSSNRALVTGGGSVGLHASSLAVGGGSGALSGLSGLDSRGLSVAATGTNAAYTSANGVQMAGGMYSSNAHLLHLSPVSSSSVASSLPSSLPSSASPSPALLSNSTSPSLLPHSNVYVAGIPHHWTKTQLDEYFQAFGAISESRVLLDKVTGMPRGIAFVRFQSMESARQAIAHCHGTIPTGHTTHK
jgi:hypothetical protein